MITSLIIGLLAGLLAKAIMPGERSEPSGWFLTMVLGLVGGAIGEVVFRILHIDAWGFVGRIIMATAGTMILISILRQFQK